MTLSRPYVWVLFTFRRRRILLGDIMKINNYYMFQISQFLHETQDFHMYPIKFQAKLIDMSDKAWRVNYQHTWEESGEKRHSVREFWIPKSQCNVSPIDDHPASQPEEDTEIKPLKCESCKYFNLIAELRYVLERD
jgi:hypothetical protein